MKVKIPDENFFISSITQQLRLLLKTLFQKTQKCKKKKKNQNRTAARQRVTARGLADGFAIKPSIIL